MCENNIASKIVLKIDTEGAEYDIISDLIETNIISKIDVLLGEGHLFERKRIYTNRFTNKSCYL